MLKTNFDDLEYSLSITIERVKRNQLLEKASRAKAISQYDSKLMIQLEDQAKLLNLIKDHYRELKSIDEWKELEAQSIKLLTHHQLFDEEMQLQYERFKRKLHERILQVRNEVDEELNEKIIERGMTHAKRSTRVKTFKNWTRI